MVTCIPNLLSVFSEGQSRLLLGFLQDNDCCCPRSRQANRDRAVYLKYHATAAFMNPRQIYVRWEVDVPFILSGFSSTMFCPQKSF